MSNIIAIDPGAVSGALALHVLGGFAVRDLPTVGGQVDVAQLSRLLDDMGVGVAVVERVGAMPKQGIASTFKFGFACGALHGVLAARGLPVHYVTPQVWKKFHGLRGTDKEASRALAIRLHPTVRGLELKKHHGRAEALLMLDWYIATKEKRP